PPPSSTLFPYTTLFRSRSGGVGIHHHGPVRVLITESGEFVNRTADIQRAGSVQGGHQHPLFGAEDLRRFTHEAHAGYHQGAGRIDRKSTRLNSSHVKIS